MNRRTRSAALVLALSLGLHGVALAWLTVAGPETAALVPPERIEVRLAPPEPEEPAPATEGPVMAPDEAPTQPPAEPPPEERPVPDPIAPEPAPPEEIAPPLESLLEPELVRPEPVPSEEIEPATTVAPREAALAAGPGDPAASQSYERALVARLQAAKRYPRAALRRRLEGECLLRLVLDRSGRLLEAAISRSSGFGILDREVLAMVDRARPFPPAPEELAGGSLEYLIPVDFTLE